MRPLDEKELAKKIVAQGDDILIDYYDDELSREKEIAKNQR